MKNKISKSRILLHSSHLTVFWGAIFIASLITAPAAAQTITVVGTPHLTGPDVPPTAEQFAHTIEKLSAFEPTQVCVERMSGERIQALAADPKRNGITFQPEMHGRNIATNILPAGIEMQMMLEISPADARDEAQELVNRWDQLDLEDQIRAIALQIAGYEFHSAVLNWSYLNESEKEKAGELLSSNIFDALDTMQISVHEVYSLAIPLARKMGLHELCTADSLEDETRGMQTAMKHDGMAILDNPDVEARTDELLEWFRQAWLPEPGPGGLTATLRLYNSEEFAELDRNLQWETLRMFDNEAGAFSRRLMYWHARTAVISAELFRALARGPEERVLFIVGSAHRAFTEADLRAQPWVEVIPAEQLLKTD
jgi:hypothetical protein